MCQLEKEEANFNYEIIFIDDGSSDNSTRVIKNLQKIDKKIRLIKFSRNFGKEVAILAGLRAAKGEAVVLVDADLQHPLELIPKMYKIWQKGIKIIYTRRKSRDGESPIKRFLSESFYKISNLLSDVKMLSGVSDFRLMDRSVVNALLRMGEYHRFSKAMFEWVGFSKECIEYNYVARSAGVSGWNYVKLFNYAILGIISFSTMPLRIAFFVGLMLSVFSGFYGAFIIIDTISNGKNVPGYASLMTIILFLGGVQLIFLGIIGQYLAQIYEQSKNRPHYIIEEEI